MENLLSPEIVAPLGWTLLHSLWQGVVLVVLYLILGKFLPSAQSKYQLGIGALVTQLLLAVITFYYVADFSSPLTSDRINLIRYISNIQVADNQYSLIENVQNFLNMNLTVIVQVWLIGMAVLFIKMGFEVWYVNRLKTKGLQKVSPQIFSKFTELMADMKITRKVAIFESNQTLSPIVVGNFTPYILLPIGLATGLSINELEAVLAHELAHIKRYDFLVNIVQSFIEICFFFSPAIWWISAQVREEREHCCDDLSVAITGDKLLLVSALSNVESYRMDNSLAMAFGKKKMPLLSRVKRILGVKQQENTNVESVLVMVVISITILGLAIFRSDDVQAQVSNFSNKLENYYTPKKLTTEVSDSKGLLKKKRQTAVIDTVITKTEESHSSNSTTISSVENDSYFNTNSRHGSFRIDKNGDIYVDGKKYDASPELRAKMKPQLEKLNSLSKEMDVYGAVMDKYGKEMDVYGKQMQEHSEPMEKHGNLMGEQGKLLEEQVKLQTKYALKASLAELDNDKEEMQRLRKLEREHELKVKIISEKMESLGKEMEKAGAKMEENSKPMEAIGKKMEIEGKKMEVIGKKIEVVAKDIVELLPPDLKIKLKTINKELVD
ncbi:MAG: M48 family metalloprotease [Arcicella sp.]|jgi:beta-lactamase regulating signal transducer with metallopeptidase domain|nr:M48 family metalloprotease [Arcicella sp.]